MENIYTYRHKISFSESDLNSALKPSVLVQIAQDVSTWHAEALGCGNSVVQTKRVIWVILRQRYQVERYPKEGEEIVVRTWPGQPRHTMFPRFLTFEDASGLRFGCASAIWALVDQESRELIPASLCGFTMPDTSMLSPPLPIPKKVIFPKAKGVESHRVVSYSDLDKNHHMNNARYLEWVCDLFEPARFLKERICDFTLNYSTEAKLGLNIGLQTVEDNNRFTIHGYDAQAGADIFTAAGEWAAR